MERLRVLQFNADRGRQATDMAERCFISAHDIALIQEPYVRFQPSNNYQRLKLHGAEEIWVKNHVDATVLLQHTSANYVTVKVNLPEPLYITRCMMNQEAIGMLG